MTSHSGNGTSTVAPYTLASREDGDKTMFYFAPQEEGRTDSPSFANKFTGRLVVQSGIEFGFYDDAFAQELLTQVNELAIPEYEVLAWQRCGCSNPNPHYHLISTSEGSQVAGGLFQRQVAVECLDRAVEVGMIDAEQRDTLLTELDTFGLPANQESFLATAQPSDRISAASGTGDSFLDMLAEAFGAGEVQVIRM
jgi:hypothetical protein